MPKRKKKRLLLYEYPFKNERDIHIGQKKEYLRTPTKKILLKRAKANVSLKICISFLS